MEQKFEGTPAAELRLEGRKITRGEVTNDWGSRLQWVVWRDGQLLTTAPARASTTYEHPDESPGRYEVALQMWKYVDYRKDAQGEFTNSKYVEISNRVSYQI